MRRFAVTLVVLLVMSPTMAMAAEWYRCTMDGQSRAACCCPGETEEAQDVPADAPANAEAACCCDIETVSTPASQPRITAEAGGAALAAFVVPRPFVEVLSAPVAVAFRRAPAVPRPSSRAPPLFLSHCSLLI